MVTIDQFPVVLDPHLKKQLDHTPFTLYTGMVSRS